MAWAAYSSLVALFPGESDPRGRVDTPSEYPIEHSGYRKTDEERDICTAHRVGGRSDEEGTGGKDRNHDEETHEVGGDLRPPPSAVDAGRVENLGNGVVGFAGDEVVGEVDGSPRDEEVRTSGGKSLKFARKSADARLANSSEIAAVTGMEIT